jgi:light-regulated signal transduction histidine kinase (bacteriophytochrome)
MNFRWRMSDRRLLLLQTTAILAVASLIGVAVAAFDRSPTLASIKMIAVIIAGGTVLVRVIGPFVARLEAQVQKLQELTRLLEAKNSQLARINRELDDFTYVASHDLKEPLRGISSYCQILSEDYAEKLDADGHRRLNSLVSLCQRLGQLIDDLLAYSRIGRTSPHLQKIDLNQVAADVTATFAATAEERGAQIVTHDLPVVMADATLVAEVLRNLVGNALKFNESLLPRVEIGAELGEPTIFFVKDNGIGIPPQHHQDVFTMFRRLHSRRKYDGTGAGLSLVRKIIEAHEGRVWLESAPGEGTTIYFTLSPTLVIQKLMTHEPCLSLTD